MDILVIGAGIAGLTAARNLHRQRLNVTVLEKSRGLGGRAATRRIEGNRVDHGAQYFTARDEGFKQEIEEWIKTGAAKVWSRGFHKLSAQGLVSASEGHPRYIFPDGMNGIGKVLGEGLDIRAETRAARVSPTDSGWTVTTTTGETFETPRVIINMPAEQARALFDPEFLADSGEVGAALDEVEMNSCFALMAGYKRELAPSWQGVSVEMNGPLSWVAHDSSKRENPKDTVLVLHATPEFTREHYDTPEEAERGMLEAVRALGRDFGTPNWTGMQRWRYAMPTRIYQERALRLSDSLVFCGDWCGGAKVEAAYLSGLAAAEAFSA